MLNGRPASVHDFQRIARRRLPQVMFEYLDGGALDEETLLRNTADFALLNIRQQALAAPSVSTRAHVLGQQAAIPLMLAPLGSLGMMHPLGEVLAFRAAHAAGIGACLSSFSICSIEEVAPEVGPGDAFQLYVLRDAGRTSEILNRASAAGFANLVLTVDTTHTGLRDRDLRNGYRSANRLNIRLVADALRHPQWLLNNWRWFRHGLGNFSHWPECGRGLMANAAYMAGQLRDDLAWADVAELRKNWPGRLIVKGVTTPEDVGRAVEAGADGIVVSTHGGRQLDGVQSSIRALPAIAEAWSGQIEILFDSGIRRGSHVFKALAAGADSCLIGRAYAYGLAAAGENGVATVLDMLRKELVMTMALAGCPDIGSLYKKRRAFLSD